MIKFNDKTKEFECNPFIFEVKIYIFEFKF